MPVLLGTDKLQIYQNKCIRIREFKEINWLPVRAGFEQNVTTHIFKQQNKLAPKYIDEMFTSADQ